MDKLPTIAQLHNQRKKILDLLAIERAYNPRVFGSVARGEAGPESDYDIVVELEAGLRGFEAFDHLDRLEKSLGQLLNRPVNIVTAAHDSAFALRVRREAMPI
ncbi:MAG: nucleotidyltransferase family protein [Candidatus Dormibacteraceae bacterium]